MVFYEKLRQHKTAQHMQLDVFRVAHCAHHDSPPKKEEEGNQR